MTRLARSAPGEAGRAAREHLELDVGRERDAAGVDPEDLLPSLDVGPGHDHLAVEAPRTEQRRVEHVRPVRRGDEDDALVGLEAVHLDEELVQRLLALVMSAAEPRAAVTADGVDLVHEDDAGRVLLALLEEVAHPRGADADEHLDEVRARDREERDIGLARDGLGEQRLARARWPDEEHALGDLPAELLELGRILQELDDLAQLFLGLVDARHVLERDLVLLLRDEPGARLAEGQRLGPTALHLAHEEDPDADEEQHGHPLEQDGVPRIRVRRLDLDLDAAVAQRLDQVRVVGGEAPERRAVAEPPRHRVASERHLPHFAALDLLQEVGEDDLAAGRLVGLEQVEQENDDQPDHHPERKVLVERVHGAEIIPQGSGRSRGRRAARRVRERRSDRGRRRPVDSGNTRRGRDRSPPRTRPESRSRRSRR